MNKLLPDTSIIIILQIDNCMNVLHIVVGKRLQLGSAGKKVTTQLGT